jgi:Holliday junction resolvase RusA-like endonuclease
MSAVEQLYAEIEIVLDVPLPPSANRLWRSARGRVFKSREYTEWMLQADLSVIGNRQYPKRKITGQFEIRILLSNKGRRGDGDNRVKGCLDFCESRQIVSNDKHCERGSWEWVAPAQAPQGCRVILKSLP